MYLQVINYYLEYHLEFFPGNTIPQTFVTFILSLLDINHWYSCFMKQSALRLSSTTSGSTRNKFVSSAKCLTFALGTALPMSWTCIKNNSGPNTDPWGTPILAQQLSEQTFDT
jgi:hypothetical protein